MPPVARGEVVSAGAPERVEAPSHLVEARAASRAAREASATSTTAGTIKAGITFQPDIYPRVLELLPVHAGARILDVGAGQGYFCQLAMERRLSIEACDFEPELFMAAGVPFRAADITRELPYDSGTFDCTVAIEVLEHLADHKRFFEEIFRITKPGGTVIVTTPNVLSVPSRWHFLMTGYTDCAPTPLDPRREDYWMQHINPIALHQILFHVERNGGELIDLTTNRIRRSAWLPTAVLYPFLWLSVRRHLLRAKYAGVLELHRRHIRWMLCRANLMGRITIAVARKGR